MEQAPLGFSSWGPHLPNHIFMKESKTRKEKKTSNFSTSKPFWFPLSWCHLEKSNNKRVQASMED
jgi:hypothetical protein